MLVENSWTLLLHHVQKSTQKWINVLNVRLETIKLLKENTDDKLLDVGLGDDFWDITPKAKQQKQK